MNRDVLNILALFAGLVLVACTGILVAITVDLLRDRRSK